MAANKRLNELTTAAALAAGNLAIIGQGTNAFKVALSVLKTFLAKTDAQIKTAYENNADTNEFDDAEQTKLAGIETAATADQTDAEVETAYNAQVGIVSQGDAEAGTATVAERWTPQRVAQAIAILPQSVLATEISTASGGAKTFTGIPSWVKKITVMVTGVSMDSTQNMLVQIGDAGGIETSGYLGAAAHMTNGGSPAVALQTTAFQVTHTSVAGAIWHGQGVLTLEDLANNVWTWDSKVARSDSALMDLYAAEKPLSDTLTQVRITLSSGSFDAGAVNIMYE